MTFAKLYANSNLSSDKLNELLEDHVDEWHEGNSNLALHEFLGLTKREYVEWFRNPESLNKILKERENL